jgi:hypothetical protein
MNCNRVQELFIDYQDGTLPADDAAAMRTHLTSCLTCQREWAALQEITRKLDHLPAEEPSPRLRENFYAMLETHQREADAPSPFALAKSRLDRFFEALLPAQPAMQFAGALAVLAIGVFVGARLLQEPQPAVVDESAKKEIADLRSQVDDMGKYLMHSLLQQKTTSERLQTILATLDQQKPDPKVLSQLIGALALDPSLNVRLSAVEALTPHADEEVVRAGLLAALPRENAPLVQLAMIELLASVRELQAAPLFERLSRDESTDKNVRDAARRALAVLRTPTPADQKPESQPKTDQGPA